MYKKVVSLVCLMLALFLLCGCGGEKTTVGSQIEKVLHLSDPFAPVSVSRIREDLVESKVFERVKDLEITNIDIIKRQTTVEDKIDKVWVDVKASNDDKTAQLYYMVTYVLYNDGWMFEDAAEDQCEDWFFKPLQGVSEEKLLEFGMPENVEIILNQLDLENGTQTVRYTYTEPHKYCTITYTDQLNLIFHFTHENAQGGCWEGNIERIDEYEEWDVNGTWEGSFQSDGYSYEMRLTIYDFPKMFSRKKMNNKFEVNGYQYRKVKHNYRDATEEEGEWREEVQRDIDSWVSTAGGYYIIFYYDKVMSNAVGEMTRIS